MFRKVLSIIPGFRTGVLWKKIIAFLVYVTSSLFTLLIVLGIILDEDKNIDSIVNLWLVISLLFFFFFIPFLLITNFLSIRKRLPLFKNRRWYIKVFSWFISFFLLVISFSVVSSQLDSLHTKEYLAKEKVDRDNRLMAEIEEKNRKIAEKELTATAAEEKKAAELDETEVAKKEAAQKVVAKETSSPVPTVTPKPSATSKPEATPVVKSQLVKEENDDSSKKSVFSGIIGKANSAIKSVKDYIGNEDPFRSDREEFKEEKVLKLLEGEQVFLEVHKKYWDMFGDDYFKQTLEFNNYIYYGETEASKPHGKGILFTTSYSEMFKKVIVPLYIGNFTDGMYDGYGRKFVNASRYYNEIFDLGNYFGYVGKDYSNLDKIGLVFQVYEGYFKDGKYGGKGNYMMVDESDSLEEPLHLIKYIKENESAINDLMNEFNESEVGLVVSNLPSLKTYTRDIGDFKVGKVDGEAKRYNDKGQLIYEGEFKKDNYHGKGKLFFDNGNIEYEGNFENGNYHGKGVLYKENGEVKYKGEFSSGDIK